MGNEYRPRGQASLLLWAQWAGYIDQLLHSMLQQLLGGATLSAAVESFTQT